jgi:hypothetical protein
MSSSFGRIISQLRAKLPRTEDRELLDKLAKAYEGAGPDEVRNELERMLEAIEGE